MKKIITVIGGGSVNWMRGLMQDIYMIDEIDGGEIRLVDPDEKLVNAVAAMLNTLNKLKGKAYSISVITDRRTALDGAEFVLTTFSPGSLDAFENDLQIPIKYGVRMPVSMTVGVCGISAALRTVPVAYEIVQDMEEMCPNAWLLNVTNPMSCVTGAMNMAAKTVKVIGMCHEFHSLPSYLGSMLGLYKPDKMDVVTYLYDWLPKQGFDYTVAGINHFIWITKAMLNGEDVLPRIKDFCFDNKSIEESGEAAQATTVFANNGEAKFALCRQFGYLPMAGDRHLIEFYSSLCNNQTGFGMRFNVSKTTIEERQWWREKNYRHINSIAEEKEPLLWEKSGEEMTEIIKAVITGGTVTSIINAPNSGQISNMPDGYVVETLADISADGIKPKDSGALPGAIGSLCRLHGDIQQMTVKAALEGDRKLLLEAMSLDPSTGVMNFMEIPDLMNDLLDANRQWLPRFFKQ